MINESIELQKLVEICHVELLKNKGPVWDYLINNRKLTEETINTFKLGLFPGDLRNIIHRVNNGVLIDNGIIYNASEHPFKLYPLMIPLQDVNGSYVGIAGRTLLSDEKRKEIGIPKYKNSVYKKAATLYGLCYAKQHIRDLNEAIVVEGYFDVITPYQHGMKNVVATCGTLLSEKQIILISRYAENINVMFDNDAPGRRAAERFIPKRSQEGIVLREKFLKDGYKDLDDYLAKNAGVDINISSRDIFSCQ